MKLWEILERKSNDDVAASSALRPCVACYLQQHHSQQTSLSYRDAYSVQLHHKRWLREQYHLDTDDVVVLAYLSSNTPDYLLSLLAATSLMDAQVALLNTRWTPLEMTAALQSERRPCRTVILFGSGYEQQARRAVENLLVNNGQHQHLAWCLPIPSFAEQRIEGGQLDRYEEVFVEETRQQSAGYDTDDALIVFTSGTTSGGPKGVRLSHRALSVQAQAKCQHPCNYDSNTCLLASTVPLFHVGGLSSVLAVLLAGGTCVFPRNSQGASFEPRSVWKSVAPGNSSSRLSANTLVVVPAMLHAMLQARAKQDDTTTTAFSAVRLILIGGQSATPSMLKELRSIFPNARLVQTYACTEAASSLTFLDVTNDNSAMRVLRPNDCPSGDCVGMPPPHVELSLFSQSVDANPRRIDRPYEVGVFATRGPHVMSGYWDRNDSSANHAPLTSERWFVTNDLGFMNEGGQFYFCGRTKDVIRTGGETVVATEVERVLLEHELIAECAVFALPDDRYGEAVCAAIVLASQDKIDISKQIIRDFCAEQGLAGYKRPRRLFLVRTLPRNSSGKVLKYRLVDRFKSQPKNLHSNL